MDFEEAIDFLVNGYQPADTTNLPPQIQERLEAAGENAQRAIAHVTHGDVERVNALIGAARASSTSGQRVIWLQKAAQALSDAYGPHAACKKGCTHCCFIPVKITQAEALHIGRMVGVKPSKAGQLPPELPIQGYESPCPFLREGACSIYDHRPWVCRSHMNLDQDELLCQLLPGMSVPVPYLDTRPLLMASFAIIGPNQPFADIRQWFSNASLKTL